MEVRQGCPNSGLHVAWSTKFCTVVSDICGSSVWNLLHVRLLAPRMLKCFLYFWIIHALLKICVVKLFVVLDVYIFVTPARVMRE